MGMYDNVVCEVDLPDGYDGDFQTKDFECDGSTYIISKDGELVCQSYEWVDVPKDERPHPDGEGFLSLIGSFKTVPLPPVVIKYHGHLNFYDFDESKQWHEYYAKFTDGKLVEITKAE